jgi:hypothetical protein
VRIAETTLSKDELAKVVARLRADRKVIAFVAPAK